MRTLVCLALMLSTVPAMAGWKALDARWRPDANPQAENQIWDAFEWIEGWSEKEQFYPKRFQPAGSIHVILKNDSPQADTVLLTHIDGVPIGDHVTTATHAGQVIWYRVESPELRPPETVNRDDAYWKLIEPAKVKAGGWAECSIRLRSVPDKPVRLRFRTGSQGHIEATVPTNPPRLRLESISFSPAIDRIYLYIRSLDGSRVGKGSLLLDGSKASSVWGGTEDLAVAEVKLDPPWKFGSHHLIEVAGLAQLVRAWDGYFTIGLYGTLTPDKVSDAKAHGINTYFTSGVSTLLDAAGLNYAPAHNVGEGRNRTPSQSGALFYQNRDEPDAHDFGYGESLPVMQRLGTLAQAEVLPTMRYQRTRDPGVPNLLLVDNTYKPLQWYVYGQIPDVYCTDPYVPLNARQIDYVPHALEVARDASTPRPLISILWACSLDGSKPGGRAPTPEEERMMAFYALGSGVKGLAYFVDLTTTTGEGDFIGLSDIKPLWEEVGRINRDVGALASYLSIGCPMIPPQQNESVWWRALLCGRDRIVLVVVNRRHSTGFDDKGITHLPAVDVRISLSLPGSFRNCRVEEVRDGRLVKAECQVKQGRLDLQLDEVDTARAFLITAD